MATLHGEPANRREIYETTMVGPTFSMMLRLCDRREYLGIDRAGLATLADLALRPAKLSGAKQQAPAPRRVDHLAGTHELRPPTNGISQKWRRRRDF